MSRYQKLFDYFYQEHNITMLEQDMQEVINIVNEMQPRPTCEAIKAAMDKAFDFLIAPYRPNTCWEDFRDRIAGESGSGWISVEERLPDAGQRVLVFCESQGVQMCHRGYSNTKETWLMSFDMTTAYLNITHWQPLPSPPTK